MSLPHWRVAYEAAGTHGIWFILPSLAVKHVPSGENDKAVAAEFGKTLLAAVLDAKARGTFDSLPLRKDCQLEIIEFDWMYEWPKESALGRSNLFRKLKAERLKIDLTKLTNSMRRDDD